ncbi:SMP-30/gluconolaconase/LRE-like region-containing protein [Janthinobacterium sp. HH01]|uniref:SMP-30/gluconolactonase/LRE family protein n=1 Tax=Janthinobacterium sp. HH01 TaxID=1198452 RepID=UPI0002AE9430|nr:SMP-30/gluconolactonase/LRE family protein [Janthinobacterium sp. HH01]ELX12693.1 SMP-30/gluconolaconase/LRE-like region-containing protein [Janthinobacterium sp. HH01]
MERLSDIACTVGESPTWSVAESAWYWVDIPARRVWRLDGATGASRYWTTTEMVACVAAKAGGGLIAGMETGIFSLELGEAEAAVQTKLAAPAAGLGAGMRFNDGRCDRQGRFWSGTMFMDMSAARAIGELYRYDVARGISAPVVSELITQNGLAFSPDGRTMYLSDSHPARRMVWAFDYDIDHGVPSGRRVFADMSTYAGRPDGAAIDSEGCYWICGNDGGCVLRFTPDGKLDRRIDVPMLKPAMCAFGGKDLDTLLVTSIVSGKPEDAEWGGAVVLLRPGVKGVAETPFGL